MLKLKNRELRVKSSKMTGYLLKKSKTVESIKNSREKKKEENHYFIKEAEKGELSEERALELLVERICSFKGKEYKETL